MTPEQSKMQVSGDRKDAVKEVGEQQDGYIPNQNEEKKLSSSEWPTEPNVVLDYRNLITPGTLVAPSSQALAP